MKKLSVLVINILITFSIFSQSEYRYFTFRVGAIHNFFGDNKNPQNRFLVVNGNDFLIKLSSDVDGGKKYFNYTPGVSAGLVYNFDYKNEKFGINIGVEYQMYGNRTTYLTNNGKYKLIEKFKVHSIGLPLYFKIGKDIYKNQTYLFFGGQYNYNISLVHSQTVDWTKDNYKDSNPKLLNKSNLLFFVGINYYVISVEASYLTKNFVFSNYVDENDFTPYGNKSKGMFLIKTSITLPFTRWLSMRSWTFEKIRRKLKFR